MEKRKHIVLVLGTIVLLVGMNFATMPIGANGVETLPPSVTKGLSEEDVYFGSVNTETTVTIEVTGNGGTDTTITPMDVVFAIDSSGSMGYTYGDPPVGVGNDPFGLRLDAAAGFLGAMVDTRDTAGVVSWDNNIDFAEGLMSDFDDTDGVEYWIYQVDSSGGTSLNVGLWGANIMLDANPRTEDSIEVIIFLTDGQSYDYTPSGTTGSPADYADDEGYIIYSIGLGSNVWEEDLEDMADATGGAYFSAPTAENLAAIYDDIYEEIVISNQPHYVDVIEVTESYIYGHNDFSIPYDTMVTASDGTTTITWLNVAQYVGDEDDALSADETVTLSFDIKVNKAGYQLEVQVEDVAIVTYDNSEGVDVDYVDIPQAYINGIFTANLIADGGSSATAIDVGDVYMWQDEDYLYVNYVTTGGWEMTETHLHVVDADGVDVIPQTKKGNPKIGKFEYSADHAPAVTEYMYTIDWTWSSGATLYIAAHAVVQMEVESLIECEEPTYRIETAWGEGTGFAGNSWAMYMVYIDP